MSPYGGEETDECDSMSVISDYDREALIDSEGLRDQISQRLKKNKKAVNIMVVGPAGVGKSSFINSVAASLSGHWHEYAYCGRHGGDTRPMTFYMKKYVDCCLVDQEYKTQYSNGPLPTLIDIAGLPNEHRDVYEEILRTLMYGRLPEEVSIARAVEIGNEEGVEGLRKKFPTMDEKLKVDRVLFLASAKEKIPDQLISCVVSAARPPGTLDNDRKRCIPVYGVLTKMDCVDKLSQEFKDREREFIGGLGLEGSEHRLLKCSNYCSETAPNRTEINSPALDVPILKFLKQVVDPHVTVGSDAEGEDYTHLNPEAGKIQIIIKCIGQLYSKVREQSPVTIVGMLALVVGIMCLLYWASSGPVVDMNKLVTTCLRFESWDVHEFPELGEVCRSLKTDQRCGTSLYIGGTFIVIGLGSVFRLLFY